MSDEELKKLNQIEKFIDNLIEQQHRGLSGFMNPETNPWSFLVIDSLPNLLGHGSDHFKSLEQLESEFKGLSQNHDRLMEHFKSGLI
jgi:hypothetical protein